MDGIMERFWPKVNKQQDGCWMWSAFKNPGGYGMFSVRGRMVLAHRFLYEITRGPIPPYEPGAYELDHVICSNSGCVNPEHMRLVSHRANMLRGNGPFARKARQTHCMHGHEFTQENTKRVKSMAPGTRACRACYRKQDAKRRAKRKLDRAEK
jgi:hypothetical protein